MAEALIALGNKLNDKEIQREGLTLSLETGRTTPEQTGLFHYVADIEQRCCSRSDADRCSVQIFEFGHAGVLPHHDTLSIIKGDGAKNCSPRG